MDLSTAILFLIVFSSGTVVVRLVMARQLNGWLLVHGALLAGLGAAWLWQPVQAGFVALPFFLVLVVIPSLGQARVQTLLFQQDFAGAARFARVLRVFHPAD